MSSTVSTSLSFPVAMTWRKPIPASEHARAMLYPKPPLWVTRETEPGCELRLARDAAERGIDVRMQVREAEAVRADDPHARPLRDREHVLFAFNSLRPAFAEASAEDHGEGHSLFSAHLEHRQYALRRNADHDEIDVVGDLRHRSIAFQPIELSILRVDRKYLSSVAILQKRADCLRTRPPGVVRHADHGNRSWLEEVLEFAHLSNAAASLTNAGYRKDGRPREGRGHLPAVYSP